MKYFKLLTRKDALVKITIFIALNIIIDFQDLVKMVEFYTLLTE